MPQPKESNCLIIIVACINITVDILGKVVFLCHGGTGSPVLIPIVLWYFILKKKRWAYILYTIYTAIMLLLGVVGIVGTYLALLHGYVSLSFIFQLILGIVYSVSCIILWRNTHH